MIHEIFNLLKDQLNTYFKTIGQDEEKVVFVDTKPPDETPKFALDKITPILINIEEERIMRPPDLYGSSLGKSIKSGNFPEIRINLLTLFVARFGDYAQGLNFLSHVIKFFQVNRVFDHHNTPKLSPDIEKLIIELSPPVLQEQDAVWNALRTSYLPSVLYKVKMLVYLDEESLRVASSVSGMDLKINQAGTSSDSPAEIPVSDDDMAVDYDTPAVVEIIDSEKGVDYQLYADGAPSGNEETSAADGDTVTLTSDSLTADTTLSIKATFPDVRGEVWLDTLIPVAVKPRTQDITIEQSPAPAPVKYGAPATIQLTNAQSGVRYQLQVNGENNGAYVECTADHQNLSLISDSVTQDMGFTVKATSTGNGQSIMLPPPGVSVTVDYTDFVINTSLQVSGPSIPVVNYNRYVTITVAASEKGVQYQLKDSTEATHGDPVPGTGGSIELLSKSLIADTTFKVEASLINNGKTETLSQTITVMVARLQFGESDNPQVQAAMSLLRAKNVITRPYTTVARLRISRQYGVERLGFQKAAGGQGSYIELVDNIPAILQITDNQTIEMWIKPHSPAGNKIQYLYFNGKNPSTSGSIYIDDEGFIVYVYDTVNGQVILATRHPVPAGEWIHIAVTRNTADGTLQWYINGIPDAGKTAEHTGSAVEDSNKDPVIAGNSGQDSYIGMVAEVRVWDTARTEDEIKNNMGKRLDNPAEEDNLVAYWKLDEGNISGPFTGTIATDASDNLETGTIHGAYWIT